MVVGGIIILNAWGIITNFSTCPGVKPIEAAASFCPLLTPIIPALTHSAIKVAVYNDNAKAKAISSGIIPTPPVKLKIVGDCFISVGYSKLKETPPSKKVKSGSNIIRIVEIISVGIRLPVSSCCFFAYV